MQRDEEEYLKSSIGKVLCLINRWKEEQEAIAEVVGKTNENPQTVERFSDLLKGAV